MRKLITGSRSSSYWHQRNFPRWHKRSQKKKKKKREREWTVAHSNGIRNSDLWAYLSRSTGCRPIPAALNFKQPIDAAAFNWLYWGGHHHLQSAFRWTVSVISPSHKGEDTIRPRQWFTYSPPTVIHTEQSISTLKTHRCVIHTESRHCSSWSPCVFKGFPRCPPVNPNPWTVYNNMDAVIMCCDWDPDLPNILESV